MNSFKIAIIEDDPSVLELMEYNFLKAGFHTVSFMDSLHALKYLNTYKVDLIITDWMMPNLDGKELVESLQKGENRNTHKFMVSCKSEENDVLDAFSSGISDFLPKPLRVKELIVRAQKKLENIEKESNLEFNDLKLNLNTFEVSYKNELIPLTKTEFQLLQILIKNKDKVHSRQEILDFLNNGEYFPTERSVDVLVSNLRKKLGEDCAVKIKTIHGLGYRLV